MLAFILFSQSLYDMCATGAEVRPTPTASGALSFLRVVGKLKQLKRTGWVHRGVQGPE